MDEPNDIDLIQNHCTELFSLKDFVMEPQVISTLLAFFQAGGQPEQIVDLLSKNYESLGQLSNLLACWLSDMEADETQPSTSSSADNYLSNARAKIEACPVVRNCLEDTISSMISKMFCSESADKIFEMDGSEGIDWLPELISHRPWRRLIFELAEHFPNCLMLNFAVKLISDAGFQHEISNINTAAQQLDIFSRVFLSSVEHLLDEFTNGINSEPFKKALSGLVRIACHNDQTFLYVEALLHVIAMKESGKVAAACNYISQSLKMTFKKREQDIAAVCIAMLQSDTDTIPSNISQAMLTMITKRALNPADIVQIYQAYFEPCPPPVDLIREPLFVHMLMDVLFNTTPPMILPEHRPKYIYVLAYAASVGETKRNGIRVQSKVDLEPTRKQLEELYAVLRNSELDLLAALATLRRLLRTPIVAASLLHHLRTFIIRDEYLGEPLPIHFVLIDLIATHHINLHVKVFQMLCDLYEDQSSCNEAAEVIMGRQRNIIDRFVHLLTCGSALMVVEKVIAMFKDGSLDVSLVRYFAIEVLDCVGPPYSREFVDAFLPMVGNPEVFDQLTLEKNVNVKEFLCNGNKLLVV